MGDWDFEEKRRAESQGRETCMIVLYYFRVEVSKHLLGLRLLLSPFVPYELIAG